MLSLGVTLFLEVQKNKTHMKLNVFKFTPSNLIKFPYEQASCESGCVTLYCIPNRASSVESLQKISVREKQGEEINHDLLDCWFCSAWGDSCPGRGGDLKK